MFLDALLRVSNNQDVDGAEAYSDKSIDLSDVTPKRAIGTGEPLGFAIAIIVAGGGSANHIFRVVESASADLTSDIILRERTFLDADAVTHLVAGALFFMEIPDGFPKLRYVGMQYDMSDDIAEIGVSAWLATRSMFSVASEHYAKGYVIS